jgi:hypothetical protein
MTTLTILCNDAVGVIEALDQHIKPVETHWAYYDESEPSPLPLCLSPACNQSL